MLLLLAIPAMPQEPATSARARPIEVTGRLLDGRGKAAAKVAVELVAEPATAEAGLLQLAGKSAPEPLARTVTETDGRFRLTAPDTGMVRVIVRPTAAMAMAANLYPLLAPIELAPLRLEPSEPLRIRLPNTAGQARIVVLPNQPERSSNGWHTERRLGLTGADGTLLLPRRRGESLDLYAVGRDFPELRLSRITAAAVELRPSAKPCLRPVRVVEGNGTAVAGAQISTERWTLGVTDSSGALAIAVPCQGALPLVARTSGGRGAVAHLQPVPADRPASPLDLMLEAPKRISGRVLDSETRAPLPGALVWVADDPAGFVRADAKGTYLLIRPPRADDGAALQLRAAVVGHLPGAAMMLAVHTTAPTFALQPTAALAGVVVDAGGRPVPSVEVTVAETRPPSGFDFAPKPEGLPLRTISGEKGAFRLDVLPRRLYTLTARRDGFAPASLVVEEKLAPSSLRSGLRIVLGPGHGAFGRIVDGSSSKAVPAAQVRLVRITSQSSLPRYLRAEEDDDLQEIEAYSDGEGAFHFEHLPPGRFDLLAKAEGFAPRTVRGLEIGAEKDAGSGDTNLGSVGLERGELLEGLVVDRRDQPLAGATVTVEPPSASGIRAEKVRHFLDPESIRETTSLADGRFSVTGLTHGTAVDVTARKHGYVSASLPQVEIPPARPMRLVLEPAARIAGRVVSDGGDPVVGAVVSVRPADAALPAGLSGQVTNSDASGSFALEDLAAGKVALSATAKGYASSEPRLLEVAEGKSVDDIELILRQGASIEGTVLTPSGTPASAARVVLQRGSAPDRMLEIEVAGFVPVDGDGHYRMEGVPTGPQTLSADQQGYQRAVRDLQVRPGENHLDLRLSEGSSVSGRVVSGEGRPLAGVAMTLYSSTPGGVQEDVNEADGTFRFAGLAAGRYTLSARKDGYSSVRQEVQLADRPLDGIELRLQQGGGTIAGRILGLPAPSIQQVQISAAKRPMDSLDALREGQADGQGGYRVEGVSPGEWTVTARLPSGRQARKSVTVADGNQPVQADLEFGSGLTLRGSVRRRGQPIPDAVVQATGTGVDSFGSAVTDAAGAFRIEGLQAGDHKVVVTVAQSGLGTERQIALTADQSVDLELPSARAAGQVVDSYTGQALAGVDVIALPAAAGAPSAFNPRATSDANGRFELTNLRAGTYRLTATRDDYGPVELRIDLPADDASLDNLRLALTQKQGP